MILSAYMNFRICCPMISAFKYDTTAMQSLSASKALLKDQAEHFVVCIF